MTITTTDHIEGKTIVEYLGIVCAANIVTFPGGNKMINRGWHGGVEAVLPLLEEDAKALGADAVVRVQFIVTGMNLCATGTAVKLA